MRTLASTTAPNVIAGLDPDDVLDGSADRRLGELTDAELVEQAMEILAVPRSDPADSFVLHAPLEVMARAGLLPYVEPDTRAAARARLAWVPTVFEATGPRVDRRAARSSREPSIEAARLVAAIDAGELGDVDDAAVALSAMSTASELVDLLADAVVTRLAAAGHGSILLANLTRVLPRSRAAAGTIRGLARELARGADWELSWMNDRPAAVGPSNDLLERLVRPPSPGDPGSNFIYPTMSLVERSGLAAEILDAPTRELDVRTARQDLLRVAAWSMLQDDPAHAPYGWSHCLTMPQAALAIAGSCRDDSVAVAVAATYVLGFRSTLGHVAIDPWRRPELADAVDVDEVLDAGPAAAAATVWHTDASSYRVLVRRLASAAAVHPDAHLAKYTLACIDASRDDPGAGRLFMAAAAHLAALWHAK